MTMTREEASDYGAEWLKDEYLDAKEREFIMISLEALKPVSVSVMYYSQVEGITPTVVNVNSCDDIISRSSAIDEIKSMFLNVPYSEKNIALSMALTKIRHLPSAEPKRKTGEWIYGEDSCGQDGWFCSKCRFFVPWYYKYYDDMDFISEYKTCPHCDAKMISYTGKESKSDR